MTPETKLKYFDRLYEAAKEFTTRTVLSELPCQVYALQEFQAICKALGQIDAETKEEKSCETCRHFGVVGRKECQGCFSENNWQPKENRK